MNQTLIFLLTIALFFSACDKENTANQYPITFIFHHSVVTNEKAYVKVDNNNFLEIDSKAGSLNTLRTFANNDMYQYVRNKFYGAYIESFEFISKDSVRLNIWNSGSVQTSTLKANYENINGEIIDQKTFGSIVKLDKNKGEIEFCLALTATIANLTAPIVSSYGLVSCNSLGVQDELKGIIDANSFKQNDTLGLYLMDMIYKE